MAPRIASCKGKHTTSTLRTIHQQSGRGIYQKNKLCRQVMEQGKKTHHVLAEHLAQCLPLVTRTLLAADASTQPATRVELEKSRDVKKSSCVCHAHSAVGHLGLRSLLTGITKTCPGGPGKPFEPGMPSRPGKPCREQKDTSKVWMR